MRPIHVSLSLGLILIAAGCQDNGEPKKDNGEPKKPEIKISDVFRDQMMKFFEVSGELEAATGQGVNILAFKEHLAKAKSSYELVSATWPDGFQPDARKSFDKAIEG